MGEWVKMRQQRQPDFTANPLNHTGMTKLYRQRFRDSRFQDHDHETDVSEPSTGPAFVVSSLASMDDVPFCLAPKEAHTLETLKKTMKKSIYTRRKQVGNGNIATGQDGRPLKKHLSYDERMALREQASLASRRWRNPNSLDPTMQLQASFSTASISPSMEQIMAIKDSLKSSPSMQIFGGRLPLSPKR